MPANLAIFDLLLAAASTPSPPFPLHSHKDKRVSLAKGAIIKVLFIWNTAIVGERQCVVNLP